MRVDFVQKVQQVVSEDLLKNGLELESVSLTGLDQTSKEHFNPNNAFDAEGPAEAIKLRADADAKRYEVDATGNKATNEAANVLSAEQVAMQVKLELLKVLPEVIRESVKPMEQIDGIKIIQVDGLNGAGSGTHGYSNGDATNLADQLINGALRYRG